MASGYELLKNLKSHKEREKKNKKRLKGNVKKTSLQAYIIKKKKKTLVLYEYRHIHIHYIHIHMYIHVHTYINTSRYNEAGGCGLCDVYV